MNSSVSSRLVLSTSEHKRPGKTAKIDPAATHVGQTLLHSNKSFLIETLMETMTAKGPNVYFYDDGKE